MPQRDAARATSAGTAPSAVPSTPDVASHDATPAPRVPAAGTAAASAPAAVPDPVAPGAPPGAEALRPVSPRAPAEPPVPPAAGAVDLPEQPLDARAVARASLAAGRSPSLWWACTGIVVALVVTFAVGAPEGALVLAAVLAVSALARAVLHPAPVALTVRSRLLDSVVLAGLALALGLLAPLIPTR